MFSFQQKRICIVAIFLILLLTAVSNADSLPVATGEWTPFTSKDMKHYGNFTQRVTIVFQEMDIEPEYRFYPWQRCFDAVIKGRVWAAFPYSYTEDRAKKVWFSDMLSCSKTLFFYYEKEDSTTPYRVQNIEDLKSYKIGGVRGYYYEDFFKKSGLDVDYVNKEINGMEKLKLGRIDLMPVNELVGWNLIATHFSGERHKFKTLSLPLSVNPLRLIISKDYPGSKKILKRFNQALSVCVEKGRLITEPCELDFGLMK
jgi:polar amino acid transport system substrate-binding protein